MPPAAIIIATVPVIPLVVILSPTVVVPIMVTIPSVIFAQIAVELAPVFPEFPPAIPEFFQRPAYVRFVAGDFLRACSRSEVLSELPSIFS
jgi:hypothetical protein